MNKLDINQLPAIVALSIVAMHYLVEMAKWFFMREAKKEREQNHREMCDTIQDSGGKIDALYEWHNHDDPNQPGVKIWWNKIHMEEAIMKLVGSVESQNRSIDTLVKTIERQIALHEKIFDDMKAK